MTPLADIVALAASHHGGEEALRRRLTCPATPAAIAATDDHRWLSAATRCVFQAGFNWQVIENRWPRFEEVFDGFELSRWAAMSEQDLDRLLKTPGIVANGAKIWSIGENARFLSGLSDAYGSVGRYFATWTVPHYTANLQELRARGARLGGRTGQVFLRRMGVDTLVFSPDVLAALACHADLSKAPSSGKGFQALQRVLDDWHRQSGRSLTEISQILAFSSG